MRARTFIAVVGAIAVFGYLGMRIFDLEMRVARLIEQVGAPMAATAHAADRTTEKPKTSALPRSYEARLAELEKSVRALKATLDNRHGSQEGGEAKLKSDEQILSVVEREVSRIRDVQLEWQRARWLEAREGQLIAFARDLKLTPEKTNALHQALGNEVEELIALMRKSELIDDPDQATSDMQTILDKTDRAAHQTLSPTEANAWNQARGFERKLLWPWLPNRPIGGDPQKPQP